ncbi:MAG: pirin family protein [Pseudomonadota bacterium]
MDATSPLPEGISMVIEPRSRDLGGFSVGRILPYAKRRMVGPFIFLDEMGPAEFAPGQGIDVRPHPHIGLATVTYLFSGEIRHKDNLGFDQVIRPGDVNWMTAGHGIVHSERTDASTRAAGHTLHGMQSWIALPADAERTDPSFHHHPGTTLPCITKDGAQLHLIAGSAFGETSPVETFSPMFYLAAQLETDAILPLPASGQERAIYVVEGTLSVNGSPLPTKRFIVLDDTDALEFRADGPCRCMVLGGAPVGERHIWWNLVASDQSLIDQAKRDWEAATQTGFPKAPFTLPPDEDEFIPLPDGP